MSEYSKHVLSRLNEGDGILFPDVAELFIVHYVGERYSFASTSGGEYTVVDTEEGVLASTNYTFEEFGDFSVKGNAQALEVLLQNGKRELSRKYRDTFEAFDNYKGFVIGSESLENPYGCYWWNLRGEGCN